MRKLVAKQASTPTRRAQGERVWQKAMASIPDTAIGKAIEGPPTIHMATAPIFGSKTHQNANANENCLNSVKRPASISPPCQYLSKNRGASVGMHS